MGEFLGHVKASPVWLVLPAVVIGCLVAFAVSGYSPLVFDPSLYPVHTADAAELGTVDAEALEAERVGDPPDVQLARSPAASGSSLADGSWTGYAACGVGNPDGWKPYYVGVTVEVSGGVVTGISSIFGSSTGGAGDSALAWDAAENQQYLDWAIAGRNGAGGVKAQLAGPAIASGVDAVSGATYSSAAIFNAYAKALAQSAAAAGVEVAESEATEVAPAQEGSKASPEKVKADHADDGKKLADGAWTGYAACGKGNPDGWKPYYVGVTIKVKGGAVKEVSKVFGTSSAEGNPEKLEWDASENQSYLDWAVGGRTRLGVTLAGVKAQIEGAISNGKSPVGIDTVSGATYSSKAVFSAYHDALAKSAAAAGSEVEAPGADADGDGTGESKSGDEEPEKVEANEEIGALADGAWTAYAQCGPDPDQVWKPYYVGLALTVANGAVASLDRVFGSSTGEAGDAALAWDADENQQYLDGALSGVGSQIEGAIAAGKPLTSVDTVSGATYSSKSIFKAYYGALAKSAAAGGAVIEKPDEPSVPGGSDNTGDSGGGGDDGKGGLADDEGDSFYGFALCESAASDWDSYYVFVQVKAPNGKVVKISKAYGDADGIVDAAVLYSASQNASYLSWAVDGKFGGRGYGMRSVVAQIQAKIDAALAVSDIQTVSGATRSSQAIVAAYEMAAENAAAGVGKTPEEAVSLVADARDDDGEDGGDGGGRDAGDADGGGADRGADVDDGTVRGADGADNSSADADAGDAGSIDGAGVGDVDSR